MLTAKPPKPRMCTVCKTSFTPQRIGAKVCSATCALTLGPSSRAKALKRALIKDKHETKQKLYKLKSKSQWTREAQTAFNAWIRLRDVDQPCISCQRHHQGQYHAGHFLSTGARPELRFEALNVHKQCAPCNNHLSGNVVLYRLNLIAKIGPEFVGWLESHHEPKKYTIQQLQAIKTDYAAKAKQLKAQL